VTERVTLITGASAGIGTELVRVFASNGHRVAMVARRADRLEALAAEIAAKGSSAPIIIPCDLEKPDAGDKIAAALTAEGVEVEFLVNNAGFGLFGRAIQLDRNEQLAMIAVNIRALTDLSLRFADHLVRNRGGLLNVASIASFLPGPGRSPRPCAGSWARAVSASPRCVRVRCRRNFSPALVMNPVSIRPC
jgi:short-subunit dehydrogenase